MNENNVERIAKILAEDHGDPQAWGAYASKAMQIIEIAQDDERRKLISDMLTIIINRLDGKDPKVKDIMLRALDEMPDSDGIPA